MQQFYFTASALLLVFATPGNKIAHPLQVGRPSMSREGVVELNHEENVVRGQTSSGVELCLHNGPSLVYGGDRPSAPRVEKVGSKNKKLLSSMILIEEKKRRAATSSGSRMEDGVLGAGAEEMGMKLVEEEVAGVSTEVETGKTKEVRLESSKKVRTE